MSYEKKYSFVLYEKKYFLWFCLVDTSLTMKVFVVLHWGLFQFLLCYTGAYFSFCCVTLGLISFFVVLH